MDGTLNKVSDRLRLAIESLPPEWKVNSLTEFAIMMDADLAKTVAKSIAEVNGKGLAAITDSKVIAKVMKATLDLFIELAA